MNNVCPYVFLDAGGVILDETKHESARAEIITAIIRSVTPQYSLDQYWRDAEEAVHRFVPNLYRYVLWKNIGDLARYRAVWEEMRLNWAKYAPPLEPMDGLGSVLDQISTRFRVCILGQYGKEMTDLLANRGLLGHFFRHDTQESFALTKPDPRYFEQVLALANADPKNSLMVGDRIDKDVIPAKMLGMKTVRIRTGLHRNQEPRIPGETPDASVARLSDLPDALDRILPPLE